MFRAERLLILTVLLLLLSPPGVLAQKKGGDVVGKVGIGVSGALNFPIFSLRDRFRSTQSYGVYLTYAKGSHTTMEVEYHRTRFDPGKLQESTFYWPEGSPSTWKRYRSPLARNFMVVNSFTINGLYHFMDRSQTGTEGQRQQITASHYVTYGGGFYHYDNYTSGLIFPGQANRGTGIDDTLLIDPFSDKDVAWGFNVGGGVEVLLGDKAGIDVRGRYHLMVGELLPINAFYMPRTYPMHYFDFGVSMKVYIGRL